jgi:hypothetical protein
MSVTAEQRNPDFESLKAQILKENHNWVERLTLIELYHESRIHLNGKQKSGRPVKGSSKSWSLRDTARELKMGVGPLSEYLRLVVDVRSFPAEYEFCTLRTAIIKFRSKIHK